ncbi:MAG: hypothetical protein K0B81_08520 [Candidatus Cloacimonetes bacterium]|nr:hypothetical protein [Candidatus Cloacimonadota bacterium]
MRLTIRGALTILIAILVMYLIIMTALGYIGPKPEKELIFPEALGPREVEYKITFLNKAYTINETLYQSYYEYYQAYSEQFPNIRTQGEYYQFIKEIHETNETIASIVQSLQTIAVGEGFNADQTLEFAMRFVQDIPYDVTKATEVTTYAQENDDQLRMDLLPRHPYITLYDQKGVCSDKTVLAAAIAEEMGYGTAIFSFDGEAMETGVGHVGLGVRCPPSYSIYNTGYCYVETTAPIRIGITNIFLSQDLQASSLYITEDSIEGLTPLNFSLAELHKLDDGAVYYGIIETYRLESELQGLAVLVDRQQMEIERQRTRLNQLNSTLNAMGSQYVEFSAEDYDMIFDEYSREVDRFNQLVDEHNRNVEDYNRAVREMNY